MSTETIRAYTDDDLEIELCIQWSRGRGPCGDGAPFDNSSPFMREAILTGPDGEEWVFTSPKQLCLADIEWESYL